MNKPKIFRSAKLFMSKHSPEILTAIGISGMIGTTVLAVKGTPKALKLIEQKKQEEQKDKLTLIEVVKTTWKCYLPAAVTGVSSTLCLIGANSVHARRHAALATAYKISESAFNEYREKVVETVGEKKEQSIKDSVDKERILKNPVSQADVIYTGYGHTLCFDPWSGRHFESDIDLIKKAENELNKQMLHDMFGYKSLNDFYDEINLPRTEVGDIIGWNVHNLIDIRIGSQVDNGRPCIVVDHHNKPDYEYEKFS